MNQPSVTLPRLRRLLLLLVVLLLLLLVMVLQAPEWSVLRARSLARRNHHVAPLGHRWAHRVLRAWAHQHKKRMAKDRAHAVPASAAGAPRPQCECGALGRISAS